MDKRIFVMMKVKQTKQPFGSSNVTFTTGLRGRAEPSELLRRQQGQTEKTEAILPYGLKTWGTI